jgi:hypothetical protein
VLFRSFIDVRWQRFVDLLNSAHIEGISEDVLSVLSELFLVDPSKSIAPILGRMYVGGHNMDERILKNREFREFVYNFLTENIEDHKEIVPKVLILDASSDEPSHLFSNLFQSFLSHFELSPANRSTLLSNFDTIISKVDDKLITYDFLYESLKLGFSSSLPYLVEVSVARAVDIADVYDLTFRATDAQTLSEPKRGRFLNTLSKILCSPKLPSGIATAFSVKLSRMLTMIPVDAQLDVLSLLQHMVRAHESVARLLQPLDVGISEISGGIEECHPQTLWEVLALRKSAFPVIADTARKLGQMNLPPEFESFGLTKIVEGCQKEPGHESGPRGNWLSGLDRIMWSFH